MKKALQKGLSGVLAASMMLSLATVGVSAANPPSPPPGGGGGSSTYTEGGATTDLESKTYDQVTFPECTGDNTAAVRAGQDVTATITNSTITKTAGSLSGDDASFYGTNSGLHTYKNANVTVEDSKVYTNAQGANGVFAYGTSTITLKNVNVDTDASQSGGIMVAGGGTMYAEDCYVVTEGGSSAAIRSDRGGGLMVVDGGTYVSNGSLGTGSPACYCVADITISNATLVANNAQSFCFEGRNPGKVYNCYLEGNYTASDDDEASNVMVYQSMSGDAEEGTSYFTMVGGVMKADNTENLKNYKMFYTTNTYCYISLYDVEMIYPDTYYCFLMDECNTNSRGWGTAGANGSECVLYCIDQDIKGDIRYDTWSLLDCYFTNGSKAETAFIQDFNGTGDRGCSVYLDASSELVITADSTVKDLYTGGASITDAAGKTVSIVAADGTAYVTGDSAYTITVTGTYSTADKSAQSEVACIGTATYYSFDPAAIVEEYVDTTYTPTDWAGNVYETACDFSAVPDVDAPTGSSEEPTPAESDTPDTPAAQLTITGPTTVAAGETITLKAEEAQAAETQPADPKPAETQPAESQPAETQPAESQPAESQPAESQPAGGDTGDAPTGEPPANGLTVVANGAAVTVTYADGTTATDCPRVGVIVTVPQDCGISVEGGTATLQEDGTYLVTPNAGPDSVTITVTAGNDGSVTEQASTAKADGSFAEYVAFLTTYAEKVKADKGYDDGFDSIIDEIAALTEDNYQSSFAYANILVADEGAPTYEAWLAGDTNGTVPTEPSNKPDAKPDGETGEETGEQTTEQPTEQPASQWTWTVSDESVATIKANDASAELTGVAAGTVTVTVTSPEGLTASAKITVTAAADTFKYADDNGKDPWNWASDYIYSVRDKGIMVGETKGSETIFRASDSLTREEAAVVALKVAGITADKTKTTTPFKDVPADKWSAMYIAAAYENKLVAGESATEFAPEANITRAEFVTMLLAAMGIKVDGTDTTVDSGFPDANGDWYAPYVAAAKAAGLTTGDEKGNFNPNADITRAEVATMVDAVKTADQPDQPDQGGDQPSEKPDGDPIPNTVSFTGTEGTYVTGGETETASGAHSLTFTVAAADGYKVTSVSTANKVTLVDNGDGSYTVSFAMDGDTDAVIDVVTEADAPAEPAEPVDAATLIAEDNSLTLTDTAVEYYITENLDVTTLTIADGVKLTADYPVIVEFDESASVENGEVDGNVQYLSDYDEVVAIVHTNDVHGHLSVEPYVKAYADYLVDTKEYSLVLTASAGDVYAGGEAVASSFNGEFIPAIMDKVYDVVAPGNNDFGLNAAAKQEILLNSLFTHTIVLDSNYTVNENGIDMKAYTESYGDAWIGNELFDELYDNISLNENGSINWSLTNQNVYTEGQSPYTQSTTFTTSEGTVIGMYGLSTSGGAASTLLDAASSIATSQKFADELRANGATVVVGVGHTGWPDGDETLTAVSSNDTNSAQIALKTTGIDAFVDGHTHSIINGGEGWMGGESNTYVNQAACFGTEIGVMYLYIKDGQVIAKDGTNLSEDEYKALVEPDAEVQKLVDIAYAKVEETLGAVLAHTDVFLNGERQSAGNAGGSVRANETNLGDLMTDVIFNATEDLGYDVDFVMYPGYWLRSSISEGDITMENIQSVFANPTVLEYVTYSAEEIVAAMQKSVSGQPNDGTMFTHVSGIQVTFTMTSGSAEVLSVTVGDTKIYENGEYLVGEDWTASGVYTLTGGEIDNWTGSTDNWFCKDKTEVQDLVANYLQNHIEGVDYTIYPNTKHPDNRIICVDADGNIVDPA